MQDYARMYRRKHSRNNDTQTVKEIKNILCSGIKPLAMLAAIILVVNPRP
jgi:hypothetical protein